MKAVDMSNHGFRSLWDAAMFMDGPLKGRCVSGPFVLIRPSELNDKPNRYILKDGFLYEQVQVYELRYVEDESRVFEVLHIVAAGTP